MVELVALLYPDPVMMLVRKFCPSANKLIEGNGKKDHFLKATCELASKIKGMGFNALFFL